MSKTAMISWVPASKGGRLRPPGNTSYRSVVRVEGDPEWPTNAWTMIVRPKRRLANGRFVVAQVDFLADDAPSGLLRKGARFQIFEGSRMVATGQVIGRGAKDPTDLRCFAETLLC